VRRPAAGVTGASAEGRTIREDQPILADRGGTASIMPVTNPLERLNGEVKRRTRPMGNRNQGLATPFALTHTF